MRQLHNRKHRGPRGAVLVEMALVIPILLFLFVGVVDYGLILREYQVLQNAAREGARLSVQKEYCISCGPTTAQQNAVLAAIRNRVVNYLSQERITIAAANVNVNQCTPINMGGGLNTLGSTITVSYTRSLLIGNGWPFGPVALRGVATWRNLYSAPAC
jgi:Flp pilus assembly protein TadG